MSTKFTEGKIFANRYEIKIFIGEGGMQHVYSAFDTRLDRLVALKTPKNSSAEKRFKRSAALSAQVTHPNVAKTLDYFEEDGRQFLIEELIDGKDLKLAIFKPLQYVDPFLVAQILHGLAKGLAALHHVGVVHRDIKLSNIMVEGGFQLGKIKITDFGIAKMIEEELAEAIEGGEESITTSKTMVGALPYMAPEMISNPRNTSTPVDIWALGALMYELLCGQKPYGEGLVAIARIHVALPPAKPAFLSSNPQFRPLAEELFAIIIQCMKKEPSERLTADELVKICDKLCYSTARRQIGYVNNIIHNAYGFITEEPTSNSIFYHQNSVWGEHPSVGNRVCFSSCAGGGANRAHPVVLMREDS